MKWLNLIPVLSLVVVLTACGTEGAKEVSAEYGSAANGTGGSSTTSETVSEEKTPEVMREDASYEGQIDSTSIEVTTESQTMALQIGEISGVEWSNIEKDTPVVIEYFKNETGQQVLTSFEVATESKIKAITEEVIYVGQIDSNSIEVITKSETLALQIGGVEGVAWSSIKKSTQVIIDYYKNDEGQYVLQSIKVK